MSNRLVTALATTATLFRPASAPVPGRSREAVAPLAAAEALASRRCRQLRKDSICRLTIKTCVVAASIFGLPAARLGAQTLSWDTNTGVGGAQGGSGDWLGTNFWWNGGVNVGWAAGNDAVFGGIPGLVFIEGEVVVDDIAFNVVGYGLRHGNNSTAADHLLLMGGELNHDITVVAGSVDCAVRVFGTEGFDKEGPGDLIIAGSLFGLGPIDHQLTGTISVNGGALTLQGGFSDVGVRMNLANTAGAQFTTTAASLTIGTLSGGGATGGNVVLDGDLTAGGDNSSRTFGGRLSGANDFTKAGTGTQMLTNANSSFTGTLRIAGGTVSTATIANSGVNSPLGAGSAIILGGGSSLEYTGNVASMNRTFTLDGALGGRIETQIAVGGGTLTLSGTIGETNGPAPLRVASTNLGYLRLTNNSSSFAGGVIVEQGGLGVTNVANSGANSQLGAGSSVTLGSAGTMEGVLVFEGASNDSTNRAVVIDRLGAIDVSTAAVVLTLNGVLSNDDSRAPAPVFTKFGAGILTLAASNTYDDPDLAAASGPDSSTDIDTGTLRLGAVDLDPIPDHSRVTVAGGATLDFSNTAEDIGSLAGSGNVINIAGTGIGLGFDNSASVAFSGAISGSAGLRKNGTGTQTISGTNTYAGATDINAGILAVSGGAAIPNTSDVTIGTGATMMLLAGETIAALAGAGAVSLGTNTLTLGTGGGTSTYSGAMTGTGALVKNGTGALTLVGSSSFTGSVTLNSGAISIASVTNSGVNGPLGAGNALVFADGRLTFTSASGTTNRGVTLTSFGTIELTNGTGTLTLNGVVGGAGNLTKEGPGTLRLGNAVNSFTDGIAVLDGAVSVASVANIGTNSPLGADGNIVLGGATNPGRLIFTGAIANTSNRNVFLQAGGGVIDVTQPATLTLAGPIVGESLTKIGPGALTLVSSTNSFSGPLSIRAGKVNHSNFTNAGVNGRLGAGNRINLGDASTVGELSYTGNASDATDRQIDLTGNGGILSITNAPGTLTSITLSGPITGNSVLTFAGGENSDMFVLTGASTRTGSTFIETVNVYIGGGTGLPDGGLVELRPGFGARLDIAVDETIGSLAGGGGATPGIVFLDANLFVGANNTSTQFDGVIDGPGGLGKFGTGTLTLTGASTFTSGIFIADGAVATSDIANTGAASPLGAGNNVTISNDATLRFTGAGGDVTNRVLQLFGPSRIDVTNPAASLTWAGTVTGVAGAPLTKDGAGELVLTGTNTFTGATTINAGKLRVSGDAALPDSFGVILSAPGTLDLAGTHEAIGSLTGSGGVLLGNGHFVTGGDDTSTIYSGMISGGGLVEKRGAGTMTLAAASSFTGGITIAEGAVSVNSLANVAVSSPLGADGTITLGDATHAGRLIATLAASNSTNRPVSLALGGGVVDIASANATLAGAISGPGSFAKAGAGRLTLSGNKSYTGATNINAGRLTLSGSIAGSAVTVLTDATLDHTGARTTGPLTLAGGTLEVGQAIGTDPLAIAGSLALNSGTFALDFDSAAPATGYDNLTVTGSVTFNGPITLTLRLAFDPAEGADIFRIIQNDGVDLTTLNGPGARLVFGGNVLEDGEVFSATTGAITQWFEIRYGLSAADNDVRLIAVSDPAAVTTFSEWAAAALGNASALPGGNHDNDGYDNLTEYALALFPVFPGAFEPAGGLHIYPEGQRMRLLFWRHIDRTDITIRVQVSLDSVTWSDLAVSVNSAPFTGPGFVSENRTHPLTEPGFVEVRDILNASGEARRYLRIFVTLSP